MKKEPMMKRLSLLLVLVLWASAVFAQTTINPTRAVFTASADHNAVQLDGTPVLTSYELDAIGMAGNGALALTVDLGKPTPDATNTISVTVAQFSTLTANAIYTATVHAKGPGGNSAAAGPSNPFARQVSQAPRPPGTPAIK